jgi:hypothetical protein
MRAAFQCIAHYLHSNVCPPARPPARKAQRAARTTDRAAEVLAEQAWVAEDYQREAREAWLQAARLEVQLEATERMLVLEQQRGRHSAVEIRRLAAVVTDTAKAPRRPSSASALPAAATSRS